MLTVELSLYLPLALATLSKLGKDRRAGSPNFLPSTDGPAAAAATAALAAETLLRLSADDE